MKPKLVKFVNGKFGIRYGWLFHTYLDFSCRKYAWSKNSPFFRDCMIDDEKTAREVFAIMYAKDEVIE